MRRFCLKVLFPTLLLFAFLASSCQTSGNAPAVLINITIIADGQQAALKVPAGSTTQSALDAANVTLNNLDRVDPPTYGVLSEGSLVRVVRVSESFEVEEIVLPFERQTVPNESLPEGQSLLVQAGTNGLQQITYRRVVEDGAEISRSVFKVTTITEAQAEIEMVGVQRPFTSIPIPGKIAYLTAGNAWVMNAATGDRQPVITTADLDGRIFSLSPDGDWLLFTRKPQPEQSDILNSLWVVEVNGDADNQPIDLKTYNIIHFADWIPGVSQTIYYSTVEPRSAPPGWQANNDLYRLRFSTSGATAETTILESSIGGIYGWWGTSYAISPNGFRLAYARPDSIGLVDTEEKTVTPLASILPLQTRSDWAWVPGIGWAPDNQTLFTVDHAPLSGMSNDETSPLFHLNAVNIQQSSFQLVQKTGMFAYPAPSPDQGDRYQIAYLKAFFPEQSENSRYQLWVMDRDGSNQRQIFPSEGLPGLEPQHVVWAKSQLPASPWWMAFIYQGNLWLIDPETAKAQQVTGDGLITHIDWK